MAETTTSALGSLFAPVQRIPVARRRKIIIFSILILVLVFRPTGLMGLSVPQKS